MKPKRWDGHSGYYRRVSHGTRGLKLELTKANKELEKSRLAWDAWIETCFSTELFRLKMSRLAWDAWIETPFIRALCTPVGRVSHGTRGLKRQKGLTIETPQKGRVSHGTRGLKLHYKHSICCYFGRVSHGTRGLKPTTCRK